MDKISIIVSWVGYLTTLIGVLATMLRLFKKFKAVANGQQCQLRNDIVTIYYKHCEEETPSLREYERKALDDLYDGYKALNGNHFIDDLYKVMRDWHVTK